MHIHDSYMANNIAHVCAMHIHVSYMAYNTAHLCAMHIHELNTRLIWLTI
jgi:hypothetical protein